MCSNISCGFFHSSFSPYSTDDDESDVSDVDSDPPEQFSFPEIDAKIREAISAYGAVFPKLNFSSPKVLFCIPMLSVLMSADQHVGCIMDPAVFLADEVHTPFRGLHAAQVF